MADLLIEVVEGAKAEVLPTTVARINAIFIVGCVMIRVESRTVLLQIMRSLITVLMISQIQEVKRDGSMTSRAVHDSPGMNHHINVVDFIVSQLFVFVISQRANADENDVRAKWWETMHDITH